MGLGGRREPMRAVGLVLTLAFLASRRCGLRWLRGDTAATHGSPGPVRAYVDPAWGIGFDVSGFLVNAAGSRGA